MICWDRCGDGYVGVFDVYEVTVLRSYAEALLKLIDHRARSYLPVVVNGQAVALLPDVVTTDRRLLAILREECGFAPEWLLPWEESACFDSVSGAVRRMLSTLPTTGGLIRLASQADADAWIRVVRLYRLSVISVTGEDGRACGMESAPTVRWLWEITEKLHEVISAMRPSVAGDSF